jgi:hypothetical protein
MLSLCRSGSLESLVNGIYHLGGNGRSFMGVISLETAGRRKTISRESNVAEDNLPPDDESQQIDETADLVPASTIDLISCLCEKSKALFVAAHETRTETDPLPRNLLAAYTRIERHVEMFFRVTNEATVQLRGSQKFLGDLALHRKECAVSMVAISKSLSCPDGFLPPHVHDFSREQCQACLTEAAGLVTELAKSFQSLAEKYGAIRDD